MQPRSSAHYVFDRPWLVPEIQEAIYGRERIVMVEGGTKTGKTTTCMIWLAEQAMEHGKLGRNFWWVSSVYATAEIAFRRLKNGLPSGLFVANESKLRLTLPNGAILGFRSAEKPDNLFGDDVYAAVGDEATRWREASYNALRTTLTVTGGPVRLLYNTKGRGNWAYRLSRKIDQGLPDARHVKVDVYVAVRAGIIPLEEVEAAKRELPESVFNELYLCIPSDDAGNPFGLQYIHRQTVDGPSEGVPIAFGVDLAWSHDWVVVTGLDRGGVVCSWDRWQGPWEMTIPRIDAMVKNTACLVDATSLQTAVVTMLQQHAREQGRSGRNYEGFVFSASSKQTLMEGLAVAIQQGKVFFPAGPITDELETFEYQYTRTGVRYTASEGLHDDCVDSLALAVRQFVAGRSRGYFIDTDYDDIPGPEPQEPYTEVLI